MACQQFDLVADHLQMPESERGRIKFPKRSMTVALPIHCDDGTTKVFTGYRVQHHLTLGPTKGGLRYHPDVTLGEVAQACRTVNAPVFAVPTGAAAKARDVSIVDVSTSGQVTVGDIVVAKFTGPMTSEILQSNVAKAMQ